MLDSATLGQRITAAINASGMRQADIAKALGVTPQAVYSWMQTGRVAKGWLPKLARLLDRPVEYFLEEKYQLPAERPKERSAEDAGSLTTEFMLVPVYDVDAAAGAGAVNHSDQARSMVCFRRDWLREAGLHAQHLAVIRARGDSMLPRIADGDSLLVDMSKRTPVDGRVYVLRVSDELRCKRLVRRADGAWVIRSDNAGPQYRDETIDEEGLKRLDIVGAVVWSGGVVI